MVIYVDIDNTICKTVGQNYARSVPLYERIKQINDLHNDGHTIIYWTARGTESGKSWFRLTKNQLDKWKCLYTELRMGKPAYDLFIDDKNINSDTFFND